jgi:hypothetical protein
MKFATIFLVFLIIAAGGIIGAGCKKSSKPGSGSAGIPGVYNVRGTIATRTYPSWPNENNYPAAYDTIAWDTLIQVVHENTDTFRFFGLGFTSMDRTDGPNCQFEEECVFFGTQDADTLNFVPVTDPGGETSGSCWFVGDSAYFLYYYNYRNITKTYTLSGLRQ